MLLFWEQALSQKSRHKGRLWFEVGNSCLLWNHPPLLQPRWPRDVTELPSATSFSSHLCHHPLPLRGGGHPLKPPIGGGPQLSTIPEGASRLPTQQ